MKLFNLFRKNKKKASSSHFADFFLHASNKEKTRVLREVALKSNEDQRKIFREASMKTETN